MSFGLPVALLLALAAPILVGLHIWQLRRRRRTAVRVPSVALIRDVVPRQTRWRRHVPVALLAAALAALGVAAARPTATVTLPVNSTSMILALDTSGSMCDTDVPPNRLTVAQEAATALVEKQTAESRIGLVTFSGVAALVVPSTNDVEKLTAALKNLTVSRGTAIGLAILAAVDAIADVNPGVPRSSVELSAPSAPTGDSAPEYRPDIIVVLTDGANTRGVDPLVAADVAAARGIRVYTIGFGTDEPAPLVCTQEQAAGGFFGRGGGLGGDPFGGSGFFGGNEPGAGRAPGFLQMDEPTLRAVADATGGEYFQASDAEQLLQVFADLPSRVEPTQQEVELSVWFALLGLLLAGTAVTLSLRWNRS